jgi:hypothetical protein
MVRLHGFDFYLKNHPYSNYDPGYPLVCGLLTSVFPAFLLPAAMRIVTFLFGAAICFFLVFGRKTFKNRVALAALLLVLHLFFLHERTHFFFFHMWAAKALVVLCLIALFKAVEDGAKWAALGIAMLAQLIKPPLSIVLPLYLLAAMPVCLWLARKEKRPAVAWTFILMLAGSLAADLLWGSLRPLEGKIPVYAFSAQTIGFYPEVVLTKLLPYVVFDHAPYMAGLGLTVLMGLLWPRQFAFPLLMLLFMSVTIGVLYLTLSPFNQDYQSGVRYLFHGFYGWQCYFLYKKLGVLTRCLK